MEEVDCLGTVLLVNVERLRELRMADGLMADGLVEVENRKGSGMTTRSLEEGSTGARTLQMASNKVLPEILIPSWLLAATCGPLQLANFGYFSLCEWPSPQMTHLILV